MVLGYAYQGAASPKEEWGRGCFATSCLVPLALHPGMHLTITPDAHHMRIVFRSV